MLILFFFRIDNITYLVNPSSDKVKGTTPIFTKDTFTKTSLFFQNVPFTVMYIAIALIGIFVLLCGLYVGTYFYNHCIIRTASSDLKSVDNISNDREGYNSLGINLQVQNDISSDPTYLEPVSDVIPHYVEIIDENDTSV